MRTYHGRRVRRMCIVLVSNDGNPANAVDLDPRTELFRHSGTFDWGYGGSGPAQLALAIIRDRIQSGERAVRIHQRFKFDVIAKLDREIWTLTAEQVDDWVKGQSS